MNQGRRFRLSLQGKRALTGLLFVSPFIVGFILFFLRPSIQSVIFSLSELSITVTGYELDFVDLRITICFTVDPQFMRIFTETVGQILVNVPAIIIFSFIAAALLNQEFKGRGLARVIFFLPVILGAGIIAQLEGADIMVQTQGLQYGAGIEAGISGQAQDVFLFSSSLTSFFLRMRLPKELLNYIVLATARVPDIISKSAIPIVVFLAGLQGIPSHIYEAADIEGANGWEKFWKITVPLISPLIVTNIVFIIVDSFTAPDNRLVRYIESTAWGRGIFGVSVAMSWVYFVVISVILVVVVKLVSRQSFTMD